MGSGTNYILLLSSWTWMLSGICTGCGPGDVTIVSGDAYDNRFAVKNLLTRAQQDIFGQNYWVGPDGAASFILNLGCRQSFDRIKLVNTHNGQVRDRATKRFRLFSSQTASGPWTQVLDTQLGDSRQQQDPLPLQMIALDTETAAQFVKLELLSWWGHGGGLQYFGINRIKEGCGPSDATIVSGAAYDNRFAVKNLLTRAQREIFGQNYWVGPDGAASFILNLGCRQTFAGIQLVNTHNGQVRDRATKQFRLYSSQTASGPWTQVLDTQLGDSRQQQDPLPLQMIALEKETDAQFVKLELVSWWGHGGGLQYFGIDRIKEASSSCKCGVPKGRRIVGGQEVSKNKYPWQVALVRNGETTPFCGGTLLSTKTVLTAAHCKVSTSQFKVHVGEHDVSIADGEQKIQPSSFTNHPQYNSGTVDNDFAIIQLSREVTFSNAIKPVCLPNSKTNYDSRTSKVTGWGTFLPGSSSPNTLYGVDVNTITNTACTTNTLYKPGEITNNMICARAAGKDACQGDSGGPLITKENNKYFSLIGVVSWGIGCAQSNAPGVYSRVTSRLSWIQGQIRGSTCPKP